MESMIDDRESWLKYCWNCFGGSHRWIPSNSLDSSSTVYFNRKMVSYVSSEYTCSGWPVIRFWSGENPVDYIHYSDETGSLSLPATHASLPLASATAFGSLVILWIIIALLTYYIIPTWKPSTQQQQQQQQHQQPQPQRRNDEEENEPQDESSSDATSKSSSSPSTSTQSTSTTHRAPPLPPRRAQSGGAR
jgi:hypothetical protein